MMMIENVINIHPLDARRTKIIRMFYLVIISAIFLLMSAFSVANAQEADQQTIHPVERHKQNSAVRSAYEKLLSDAEILINRGKPTEAYLLLSPFEFEYSGDERFDYLIGIAALDSGKPDKATFALERVLIVNPNSAAARLDMARAYFQLGDFLRAKNEFATALKQNPGEVARANIEKYLEEISAQEAEGQTRTTGYIEGTLGHDSNVNNSSSQTQIYVDALAANATLDSTNIRTSDNYYSVATGGEISHRLTSQWGLFAGADLRRRSYLIQNDFDAVSLDGRVGITLDAQENHLRIGLSGEQYSLGNVHNSDATGFGAEWRHVLSPANQLKIFGQYAKYRFADVAMKTNDYDLQAIGAGWLHVFSDGKSTLFGSLYHGAENDVSTIVVLPASPSGGRNDGAKQFNGFKIAGQTIVSGKTTLFVNAGSQYADYSKLNYWFQRNRQDRLYDLTVGANWRWDNHWTVRPQLNFSMNDSNIAIYSYNRIDVLLTIRRDFR